MSGPDIHYYEPSSGHGLPHDPFNAIIGPRPIGWISTVDEQGVRNLAPYSFFNGFNYKPPIIGFSSTSWKHTVANIRATGEFVWNLATRELGEQMNATCAHVAEDVDEFDLAGLTGLPSRTVKPQRVAESPVHFECKLTQFIQLQDAAGKAIEAWMVLGEVVAVHIDRRLLKDGIYDTAGAGHILRAGGPSAYIEVKPEAVFHMRRPA
jgi:flavin reductase (DIM6/NTAB) family NADH-FMN oxidoreductase RutF